MKRAHVVAAAALAACAALFAATVASGTEKMAKSERLECGACHDKPGSKLLTDRGKYYETMGTVEGFDELAATFGRCTSCHVKKPGSLKLTAKGKQFQELAGDMQGLADWMSAHHPLAPVAPAAPAEPVEPPRKQEPNEE